MGGGCGCWITWKSFILSDGLPYKWIVLLNAEAREWLGWDNGRGSARRGRDRDGVGSDSLTARTID